MKMRAYVDPYPEVGGLQVDQLRMSAYGNKPHVADIATDYYAGHWIELDLDPEMVSRFREIAEEYWAMERKIRKAWSDEYYAGRPSGGVSFVSSEG